MGVWRYGIMELSSAANRNKELRINKIEMSLALVYLVHNR